MRKSFAVMKHNTLQADHDSITYEPVPRMLSTNATGPFWMNNTDIRAFEPISPSSMGWMVEKKSLKDARGAGLYMRPFSKVTTRLLAASCLSAIFIPPKPALTVL